MSLHPDCDTRFGEGCRHDLPVNHRRTRDGAVLLVLLGVALLLIGMVFFITLKVYRGRSESLELNKFAQAYCVAQAARVYLHGAWLAGSASGLTALSTMAAAGSPTLATMRGSAQTQVFTWPTGRTAGKPTVAPEVVITTPERLLAATGWFAFMPSGGKYLVLAVGGASYRTNVQDPRLIPSDCRLYLRYDPATDRFDEGPTLTPTWSATPLWMRLVTP